MILRLGWNWAAERDDRARRPGFYCVLWLLPAQVTPQPAWASLLTEIDTFPAPPSFQVMEGWLEITTQTVSLHPVVGPLVIHLFAK